jgi:excisionase family DNA binding protein
MPTRHYTDAISIQWASRRLGVSRTQIYRLLIDGILLEIMQGDKRMVGTESVDRYEKLKREKQKIEIAMRQPINR